jgi:eukaryotic-like serine/threonine-protein kinase
MVCPQCTYENSATSTQCEKCATPLPINDLTLNDLTLATGGEGWSVPAAGDGVVVAQPLGQLQPGGVLGDRYEIVQLLGQGGMGAVYQAYDRELERQVALKVIRADMAANPEILRRFKQELILARQITHRNVIRIFDLGQADSIKFITMEYIEGEDLQALLRKKKKLDPSEAVNIIAQVCRALEAAHAEGVIHRDLKPQNVMMDKTGRAYVMDFGIARSMIASGMTQTGALIGTPDYMSPEQAKGLSLDARSDLFTVGIILYELLTGQVPFQADSTMGKLWKRTNEAARPATEVDKDIPQALSNIIQKCLEIDPQKRFASATELLHELEIWQGPNASTRLVIQQKAGLPAYFKWGTVGAVVVLSTALILFRSKIGESPAIAHAPMTLLIADFDNKTGDSVFDGTLEPCSASPSKAPPSSPLTTESRPKRLARRYRKTPYISTKSSLNS